jgi:leucine-rich repeat protein SHOC2
MINLTRLDLSYNNIVKLSPKIGEMTNLQQLWLNDNPLREIPIEISKCHKLKVSSIVINFDRNLI